MSLGIVACNPFAKRRNTKRLGITDLALSTSHKNLMISANVRNVSSNGEEYVNPNFIEGISSDSLYNNYFDLKSIGLAANYKWNDNLRWVNRIGYDERDFSAKYFYTQSSYDESIEKINNKAIAVIILFINFSLGLSFV